MSWFDHPVRGRQWRVDGGIEVILSAQEELLVAKTL
jgi:hypothetical protein